MRCSHASEVSSSLPRVTSHSALGFPEDLHDSAQLALTNTLAVRIPTVAGHAAAKLGAWGGATAINCSIQSAPLTSGSAGMSSQSRFIRTTASAEMW